MSDAEKKSMDDESRDRYGFKGTLSAFHLSGGQRHKTVLLDVSGPYECQ
jgi:hypothetical protein